MAAAAHVEGASCYSGQPDGAALRSRLSQERPARRSLAGSTIVEGLGLGVDGGAGRRGALPVAREEEVLAPDVFGPAVGSALIDLGTGGWVAGSGFDDLDSSYGCSAWSALRSLLLVDFPFFLLRAASIFSSFAAFTAIRCSFALWMSDATLRARSSNGRGGNISASGKNLASSFNSACVLEDSMSSTCRSNDWTANSERSTKLRRIRKHHVMVAARAFFF